MLEFSVSSSCGMIETLFKLFFKNNRIYEVTCIFIPYVLLLCYSVLNTTLLGPKYFLLFNFMIICRKSFVIVKHLTLYLLNFELRLLTLYRLLSRS